MFVFHGKMTISKNTIPVVIHIFIGLHIYGHNEKSMTQLKSWVDQEPSYASNEICLNWNAPLAYVLGFLEQESK